MRILYDDRELIEHLKTENASLRAQVAEFKEAFTKLEVVFHKEIYEVSCKIEALKTQSKPTVERKPLTAWNGVPIAQARDVDWERMGLQPPPETRR